MLTYQQIALSVPRGPGNGAVTGAALQKVHAYLADRGITPQDMIDLGMVVVPHHRLLTLMRLGGSSREPPNDGRVALVIPHWSFPIKDAIEWWSARIIDTSDSVPGLRLVTSFADVAERKSFGKMLCPPQEAPHSYLPPICNWDALGYGEKIYIHESVIKAINGAKLGKFSVGLNGVWGWGSKKHSQALTPELLSLPWKALKLQPVILFDSNIDHWHVAEAASKLAERLHQITEQRAVLLRLPKDQDGEDQGFDDFHVRAGSGAALKFLEGECEPIDTDPVLLGKITLNNEVCVVRELGRVATQADGTLMNRAVFTDLTYADRIVQIDDPQRPEKMLRVNIPKAWLEWEHRTEVTHLEYEPGKDRLNNGALNLWRGMGVEPEQVPTNVDPWVELISNNIQDERLCNWVMDWLAYPLQNLGAKMNTNLMIFGPAGTGKNLFFKPIHAIYGVNGVTMSNSQIASAFNSVYAQKQFVHADELVRQKKDYDAEVINQRIKMLVTDERLIVNTKGQPEYQVNNHLNLVITSNYPDCVKLDIDDRRMCVIRWEPWQSELDHRGDQTYWRTYVDWAQGPGPAALYRFLLDRDLSRFDPAAWAPSTEWKEEVKEATAGSVELFARDLYKDPDLVLPAFNSNAQALYSAKALASICWVGEEINRARVLSMSNALRNAGFKQAAGGAQLRRADATRDRYWIIRARTREEWRSVEACTRHIRLHNA